VSNPTTINARHNAGKGRQYVAKLPTKHTKGLPGIAVTGVKLKDGKLEKTSHRKLDVSAKIAQRRSKRIRVSKTVKGAQRP
jgi:hypothetical protein